MKTQEAKDSLACSDKTKTNLIHIFYALKFCQSAANFNSFQTGMTAKHPSRSGILLKEKCKNPLAQLPKFSSQY